VFEHTWKELELWLEHLGSTVEESKETVIQFLERVSTGAPAELHVRDNYTPVPLSRIDAQCQEDTCGGSRPMG
jgi:hypothetical protein